ncbi:MAG: LytR C-terminal domain-containing protein [candidate division WOR-3 bacterium]|nr:LytR C-terminal domain-containing protein [candidate division WOR-3 bacterium]MCX7757780.1 LytR C-terminal domain-containing protein [candidate division WOR-3 bacterium]MDW7988066.1 LytR C-terminal domain-containing protein [candidate division WOR-3 bacterium]
MKKFFLLLVLLIFLMGIISWILINHYGFFSLNPQPVDYNKRSKIRVEIINCSGKQEISTKAQKYLRILGFDVYDIRNAKRVIDKTTVIERVDPNLSNASEIANALSVSKKVSLFSLHKKIAPEIKLHLDSTLYLEATVVLGKDAAIFFADQRIYQADSVIVK